MGILYDLHIHVESARSRMNLLAETKGINHPDTLIQSQALDELIVQAQKEKMKLDKGQIYRSRQGKEVVGGEL